MKYIINTDDLYGGDIYKSMLLMGTNGKGEVIVQKFNLDELEELTADYINEHFGDLQDDAYERGHGIGHQKGLEDGKKATWGLVADASSAEYQKGLDDAWECARKLFSSMADSDIEKAFPTEWNNGGFHALINLKPQVAIEKLKAYEEQKADDEIKVGDEVEIIGTGNKFFIVGYEDDCICGFAYGGKTCRVKPVFAQKTGRHIDIEKILKGMKE